MAAFLVVKKVKCLPPRRGGPPLRQDADDADFFDQQVEQFGDIFALHAGAAHALLLADAVGVDGAVEAVALVDGAIAHALPADPVFADGILGVVAGELLARARVDPGRIDELAVLLDNVVAHGCAVAFAQAKLIALDEEPVGGIIRRASEDVGAVHGLVKDCVEGTFHELDGLACAEGVGIGNAVDALDEAPVGGEFALAGDSHEAVAWLHFVAFDKRVGRLNTDAEDEVLVDRGEFGTQRSLVGVAGFAIKQGFAVGGAGFDEFVAAHGAVALLDELQHREVGGDGSGRCNAGRCWRGG